jgi:hypothetical protein
MVLLFRFRRHHLQHVPLLDDLAIAVETEDIDTRPIFVAITRPLLVTMHYDVVAPSDQALEVHAFPRVLLGHAARNRR